MTDLIVSTIQECCVLIHKLVREAPLKNNHGEYDHKENNKNVSNDIVQKLDILSNNILISHLSTLPLIYSLASEENENELICNKEGKYRVVFDPLDGSSNISAGIPTGTIWGIEDLSNNYEMIRSGYAMYSSSLYFLDTGVDLNKKDISLSVYDYSVNKFQEIDKKGIKKMKQYSINESNTLRWDHSVCDYILYLKENGYTQRWIGTMVADIHRTILYGGVFCYPVEKISKNGKLRLVYECRPMALIFRKLGGMAVNTTTLENILDMDIKNIKNNIHQKCGVIMGDKNLVEIFLERNKVLKSKL